MTTNELLHRAPTRALARGLSTGDYSRVPVKALQFSEDTELVFADGALAVGEDADVPFKMRLNSGKPMKHWWFGMVVIDVESARFAKPTIPALDGHDFEKIVGIIDKKDFTKAMDVEGVIYHDEPAAEAILRRLRKKKAKFPYQASGWFRPGKVMRLEKGASQEVNGFTFKGPGQIWYDTEILEGSFTPFGVDSNTNVNLAAGEGGGEVIDLSRVFSEETTEMAEKKEKDDLVATAEQVEAAKTDGREAGFKAGTEKAAEDARKELKLMLDAMPERPKFAAERFAEGKSVTEAKAELADVLEKELKDVRAKAAEKTDADDDVDFTASDEQNPEGKTSEEADTTVEARSEKEWKKNGELREGFHDNYDEYLAYARAKEKGLVHVQGDTA